MHLNNSESEGCEVIANSGQTNKLWFNHMGSAGSSNFLALVIAHYAPRVHHSTDCIRRLLWLSRKKIPADSLIRFGQYWLTTKWH